MCSVQTVSGERYSFMVERPLKVRWVVGSIPHGRCTELFLVSTSVPSNGVTRAVVCYPIYGMLHISDAI